MSEMSATVLAQDLCPCHAQRAVRDPFYCVWEIIIECRPSAAGVELGVSTAGAPFESVWDSTPENDWM